MSREALDALRLFNNPPSLFARAGKAVCVTVDEARRHVITDVSDRILRNRLTRSADFYEVRTKIQNCAPPIDVVKDILAMSPIEWHFPRLHSIIESPALREDGTLITLPGYDEPSRLYYAPDPSLILPEIPQKPCTDHIQLAVEMVQDIIGEFPFVDTASRVNAFASMLTPVCRPAIKGPTPLALFDATAQGTGKTLLSEVVSLIVSGREGALFSAPREPEEWRKQLTSVLRGRIATIIIDNVNCTLDSAELCKALTETIHGDRILGQSQTINLPVRCTWIATGNDIQLGGDMPRRCHWIRMDPKCPRPFERTGFRHKRLKQYVLVHRGELLAACTHWLAPGLSLAARNRMSSPLVALKTGQRSWAAFCSMPASKVFLPIPLSYTSRRTLSRCSGKHFSKRSTVRSIVSLSLLPKYGNG